MSTILLADVKDHLNITGSNHDGELLAFLEAAEAVIEGRCGPLGQVTKTQSTRGYGAPIVLEVTPVVSVTSVTPAGGTAFAANMLEVDLNAGTIARTSASFGTGLYDIVYVAGRTTLPADLRLAVYELVRHMWETQRGPTRRPGSMTSDSASNTLPGAAYMLPFRVEQLLQPHTQFFGFA